MDSFETNVKNYLKSKSPVLLLECSKQAVEKIQAASDKNRNLTVASLFKEGLKEMLALEPEAHDQITRSNICIVLVHSIYSNELAENSHLVLNFIKTTLENKDGEACCEANRFILNLAESKIAFDDIISSGVLLTYKDFFNRRVHYTKLFSAAEALKSVFSLKANKEQTLQILIDGLMYCITHIDHKIIRLGVEAAIPLVDGSPEIADELMNMFFFDDVYAQFRHPDNNLKAEILKFFTKSANLGPKFRKYIGEHQIADRISAFLCHYSSEVCMECINLLEALDYSLQKAIDNKYIITLILHVSMSAYEFRIKCFNLLEKYLYKADASQVRVISDEGYIRPFLTLAVNTNTSSYDKERILKLLKYLIDDFDILKIRIVQFDFDHAHDAEEFSCVNQLMQLMEDESSNIKIMASHILDELRKIGIVNHMNPDRS